jgi:small subunit ribosomal protein S7
MSRRREAVRRDVTSDPRYNSVLVATFINHLMKSGKKSIAEDIVYGALDVLADRMKAKQASKKSEGEGEDEGGSSRSGGMPIQVYFLDQALDNVRPAVEVRPRRVGGATYQVPMEVRDARRDALAMRWVIQSARDRSEKGMIQRLANELIDAVEGKGSAVKKREEVHKMAKANQAFAHFRWN